MARDGACRGTSSDNCVSGVVSILGLTRFGPARCGPSYPAWPFFLRLAVGRNFGCEKAHGPGWFLAD